VKTSRQKHKSRAKTQEARSKRREAKRHPELCGIPANGGMLGFAPCDLPWGHPGDLHGNGGDGFYSPRTDDEHHKRQSVLTKSVAATKEKS
jgi:hypothetical protein